MEDAVNWSRRMEGAAVRVRYNPKSFGTSLLLEDEQLSPASVAQQVAIDDSKFVAAGD